MKIISLTTLMMMFLAFCSRPAEEDRWRKACERMLKEQIRARGVKDERVLSSMRDVPRHVFVSDVDRHRAYEDCPLPIGYHQTISQPYIVAYMTEILHLKGSERVLEIGTGCGYQTAVLARIAREVYSVEVIRELAEASARRLQELGYPNAHVKQSDGFGGWPEEAPFDAIIVTAAPVDIPPELIQQLKVGGRMIIPLGSVEQQLALVTKTDTGLRQHNVMPVRFVPMVEGK